MKILILDRLNLNQMVSRICIAFLFLVLRAGICHAQTTNISLGDFYKNFRNYQYGRMFGESNEIKGSPYENEQFVTGDICVSGLQRYSGIPLRYNIYSNQIEFRKPDGEILEISPPDIIDSVLIGKSKFIYYPYKTGSKNQKCFFEVLTEKQPMLLLMRIVKLYPAEPAGGYKDPKPATFERIRDEFYLAEYPGEAVKIDNKKDVLELLASHTAEIEEFIKQNKTKFGKLEEVIKLMEFYYSLGN